MSPLFKIQLFWKASVNAFPLAIVGPSCENVEIESSNISLP